jgi:hypothetical protein
MSVKMIVKAAAAAIGLGALLAGSALAGATGGSAGSGAEKAQPKSTDDDGSRRVCRILTPTGSRMTRRVCRTQAQWDENMDRAQEGLFGLQQGQGTSTEQMRQPN